MIKKKKKFIEENPHYEELSPEEIKMRDNISYLTLDEDFNLTEKQIKKDAKIKSQDGNV